MPVHITAIGTANPVVRIPQMEIANFMAQTLGLAAGKARALSRLYEATGIAFRHTVMTDYEREPGDYEFFPNSRDLEPFPGTAARMAEFRKHALTLSLAAIENCLQKLNGSRSRPVTHLITVSCTGMYAPGLGIEIIERLGLPGNVQRTAINFMGCYAAFNALKTANAICRSEPGARVLIVCVELCSLHFQKSLEKDHLVANALFADGAAAVTVEAQPTEGRNLSLDAFYCDLAPQGKHDMAWHITDFGFEMALSTYVPDIIRQGIGELTGKLLAQLDIPLQAVEYFAVHPGGRRILEACETALGISREDNRYSYEVLQNYGNMSSPTVLFVLERLLRSCGPDDDGKRVLSFAFGPGLTLESALMSVKYVS